MERVWIDAVTRAPKDPEQPPRGYLDLPLPGDAIDSYVFMIRGWAHGAGGAVSCFQARTCGRVIAEVSPNQSRPDIAQALGQEAGEWGFEMLLEAIELDASFAIEVVAVMDDGSHRPLGRIEGRRAPLSLTRRPQISPVMITTIGRSGSKWLAWLLSCHPAIVGFQPLMFEPHVGAYWASVLRALTTPQSYLSQLHNDRLHEPHWWLGRDAGKLPAPPGLGMGEWLGGDAIDELATVCAQRVETFYSEVARRSEKRQVRYFVEKFLLDHVLLDITLQSFPDAREVILVRDFRDRLSSVFAWNERHGDHGFGQNPHMSLAEYLTGPVLADAQTLLERWRRRDGEAHLVRYEDLVLEPAATLGGLLRFLELESDDHTVESLLELAAQPGELMAAHRTIADPAQTIGRWREDLPADFARDANDVLAPMLHAFGYSTEPVEAGSESAGAAGAMPVEAGSGDLGGGRSAEQR